ncbi:hypothetical protein F4703DRAFT_1490036 [Phycomyces blakesleeanus]
MKLMYLSLSFFLFIFFICLSTHTHIYIFYLIRIGLKVICSGVDYNYRTKTGIPLYSDYGHAVATASDICVSISVSPSGNDPSSYKVDKCICTIGDFDISFQETRHSLLNRLSIKKFKKNIKHVLIENIQRGVATIFSQLFSHQ